MAIKHKLCAQSKQMGYTDQYKHYYGNAFDLNNNYYINAKVII